MAVRLGIQERQRFFREGLAMVLDGEPDLDVVGAVATAGELTELHDRERPDVVILEVDVAEWDACRLAAALQKRSRSLRIVGLGGAVDRATAVRAYQAGVRALVHRDGGLRDVLGAVRSGWSSAAALSSLPDRTAPAASQLRLTPRELEVLGLVSIGCTTRDVSARLGISPKTVENHKQRIFAKLGVQNQARAVALALRSGELAPTRTAVGH